MGAFMRDRRDGLETRRRILLAACEVFAERGYRGTTNAEICRRSGANGAAINYHFRSKESLYVAAFKLALEDSLKAHLVIRGGKERQPIKKLSDTIRATIVRITDPANKSFAMLHKEMSEPTGLLDEAMGAFVGFEMDEMKAMISEILGPAAAPDNVEMCATSIIAQCVHPSLRERRRIDGMSREGSGPRSNPLDVDKLAAHVLKFSVAGLESYSLKTKKKRSRG